MIPSCIGIACNALAVIPHDELYLSLVLDKSGVMLSAFRSEYGKKKNNPTDVKVNFHSRCLEGPLITWRCVVFFFFSHYPECIAEGMPVSAPQYMIKG